MQSKIASQVLQTDENMVIAAPTGSGKTVLFEMAIVRAISSIPSNNFKCLLIAPSKALCQQRVIEWSKCFNEVGLRVIEVTGDIDLKDNADLIATANILVTTPEMWDVLTKLGSVYTDIIKNVSLLLLDEIHHIGDERGSTLEALVIRIKTWKLNDGQFRIIGLSATLPNVQDIGSWLNCKDEYIHLFSNEFRPVPLHVEVLALGNNRNAFLFDKSLDDKVDGVINKYSNNRQVLIFCHSKKSAEVLAKKLSNSRSSNQNLNVETIELLLCLDDENIRQLIMKGRISYHHSGLSSEDRSIIENLYLSGVILILCSTSTLSQGMNLPAHLVIIKGTSSWRGSSTGYVRTKRSDIIQMIGRAGRPGFDEFGVAVVMTSNEEKPFYSDLTDGADIVESNLLTNLTEC
eukprot:gene17164-22679_t